MSGSGSVWLFNIKNRNWQQCRQGPPEMDVHGDHVGHPFHGLSDRISYLSETMTEGDVAIIRESTVGIRELWEIVDVAPVTDQSHHRWVTEEGNSEPYDTFVYCRRIQTFEPRIKETNHRITGQDFARFNKGANVLKPEYVSKFFEAIRADGDLNQQTKRRLDVAEAALTSADNSTRSAGNNPQSSHGASEFSDSAELTKPSTENTTGQVGSSGGKSEQISERFRRDILSLYENTCLLSDIRGSPFLTVAHVVPRSDDSELVEHPDNVLVLCRDLHAAFDDFLFTFDTDLRLRVDPDFEPEDEFLKRTLTSRDGEQIKLPQPNGIEVTIDKEFLRRRNEKIAWLS